MKTSLFSTSLTALPLEDAIRVTAAVGYDAIELGCFEPHLTLETAEQRGDEVRAWLRESSIDVSALSLIVSYTSEDEGAWRRNVDETCRFIRLCAEFGTGLMKIMPGEPGSAQAGDAQWERYGRAMDIITPLARAEGVKLAVEYHLNHLSDSIETAARCLDAADPDVLGINLDFCNVRTCGDSPIDAIERFADRTFLAHIKDSRFDRDSGEYVPMGEGKMQYPPIIRRLRDTAYDGYLSVECLYPRAKTDDPRGAVAHDLAVLRELLSESPP